MAEKSGFHSEFSSWFGKIASKVALHVRGKMFQVFMENFGQAKSILDLGVTSESVAPEANFFEELFPNKNLITAAGVEDASNLEKKYPGLKFIKIAPNNALPFKDKQFEVLFSNAVIEHVVGQKERVFFLQELSRVAKSVFITTPCKYFPVEHHTGVPLLHFLCPKLFYSLLDKKILSEFYSSQNLSLLSRSQLESLAAGTGRPYQIIPIRFFGFVSNYVLILN